MIDVITDKKKPPWLIIGIGQIPVAVLAANDLEVTLYNMKIDSENMISEKINNPNFHPKKTPKAPTGDVTNRCP